MPTKPSNKQKAQRERFAIKGFLVSVQSRISQLRTSPYMAGTEKDRLILMNDCATESLKYFDGWTHDIIKETKNV